jgi:hypothetical protein
MSKKADLQQLRYVVGHDCHSSRTQLLLAGVEETQKAVEARLPACVCAGAALYMSKSTGRLLSMTAAAAESWLIECSSGSRMQRKAGYALRSTLQYR